MQRARFRIFLFTSLLTSTVCAQDFDVIIKNGTVYDGSGSEGPVTILRDERGPLRILNQHHGRRRERLDGFLKPGLRQRRTEKKREENQPKPHRLSMPRRPTGRKGTREAASAP